MPEPAQQRQQESQSSREEILAQLGKINIPPPPEIVQALLAERDQDVPDVERLTRLIAADAGLSAALLADINSPYRRRAGRTDSIQQAVSELGVMGATTVALGEMLHRSLPAQRMNQFWERIGRSARVAHILAAHLGLDMSDDAQLYVLFHDCGMPVIAEVIPEYHHTLEQIIATEWLEITELEDTRHNINHALVGGVLANTWGLPPSIREATSWHHHPQIFNSTGVYNEVLTLIALGHAAEMIEESISKQSNDNDWEAFSVACLDHLMISDAELQEFIQTAKALLAS